MSAVPTLCTVSWESMRLQRIAAGNFEGVDRVHDSNHLLMKKTIAQASVRAAQVTALAKNSDCASDRAETQ